MAFLATLKLRAAINDSAVRFRGLRVYGFRVWWFGGLGFRVYRV